MAEADNELRERIVELESQLAIAVDRITGLEQVAALLNENQLAAAENQLAAARQMGDLLRTLNGLDGAEPEFVEAFVRQWSLPPELAIVGTESKPEQGGVTAWRPRKRLSNS